MGISRFDKAFAFIAEKSSVKLPQPIIDRLWVIPLAALGASFGWFGTQFVDALAGPFWKYIAPVIPQKLLLSLCLLLLLVSVILVGLLIYLLRPAHFDSQFRFDEEASLYTHKTKAGYFCPTCKAKGKLSQMGRTDTGWLCPDRTCKHYHRDKPYPAGPTHSPGQGWHV